MPGPIAALAGGSIVGGVVQARAAGKASDAQRAMGEAGIAEQRRQFDRTEKLMEPWRKTGQTGLNRLDNWTRRIDDKNATFSRQQEDAAGDLWRRMDGTLDNYATRSDRITNTYEDRLSDARGGYDEIMGREFEADPGYQFRLEQGEKAINRGASARGNVLSGATMQALGNFNSGLASQEYGAFDARRNRDATQSFGMDADMAGSLYGARMDRQENMLRGRTGNAAAAYDADMSNISSKYGRFMDRGNALANLAGIGQTASQNLAGAGQSMANSVSNLYGNIGQARAQGYQNSANAMSGTINSLSGVYGAAQAGQFGANPGFGITPSPAGVKAWGWS